RTMLGNLLSLLAALTWAASTLQMRPLVLRMPSLEVVVVSNLMAMPVLLLLALPSLLSQNWGAVNPVGWTQMVVSGLLAISLAYAIWGKGVQRLGGARTAVYSN